MNAIDRPKLPDRMATAEDWATFLKPMLAVIGAKPSREEFQTRAAAIAYALPDVPADMLSGWRQRDLLRTFHFLPSPKEVTDWIGPSLVDRKRTAQALAITAPRPEPRAERTPEEVEAVRAKVHAFAAEMVAKREVQRVVAKPVCLTGEMLAEQRRHVAERIRAGQGVRA